MNLQKILTFEKLAVAMRRPSGLVVIVSLVFISGYVIGAKWPLAFLTARANLTSAAQCATPLPPGFRYSSDDPRQFCPPPPRLPLGAGNGPNGSMGYPGMQRPLGPQGLRQGSVMPPGSQIGPQMPPQNIRAGRAGQ